MNYDSNEIINPAFLSRAQHQQQQSMIRGRGRGGRPMGPPDYNYAHGAGHGYMPNESDNTFQPPYANASVSRFGQEHNGARGAHPYGRGGVGGGGRPYTRGRGSAAGAGRGYANNNYTSSPAPYIPYNNQYDQPNRNEDYYDDYNTYKAPPKPSPNKAPPIERQNGNYTNKTGGNGKGKSVQKKRAEWQPQPVGRSQLHLPAVYVRSVKGLRQYTDHLEIVADVFGDLASEVRTMEFGRKEFDLCDRSGRMTVSYYEIDEVFPRCARNCVLKVSVLWRDWGLQAVGVELADNNYGTHHEQKIRLSDKTLLNNLQLLGLK